METALLLLLKAGDHVINGRLTIFHHGDSELRADVGEGIKATDHGFAHIPLAF